VFRYALADWRGWALIIVVTLLSGAVGLLQPWPLKIVFDHVLGSEPMGRALAGGLELLPGGTTPHALIAWMALAGVGIFALSSALDVLLTRAWDRVGQGMVYRLAHDLFAKLQRRSLLFHSRNSVGDAMSRITGDSWCAYKAVNALLFTPGYSLVMTVGMVGLMARMDLGLTLVGLAVAPLVTGSTFLFGRPIRRAARARREIESRMHSHVHQTLSGISVVQAFAQEESGDERFEEFASAALRAKRHSTLVGSLSGLVTGLIAALGTGAILWLGAWHVLDGRLTVGSLLVFLAYLGSLQGQIKAFTGVYSTLQELGASTARVLDVLEAEPEVKDRPGASSLPQSDGRVCLEDITFGYETGRPVLRNVSLEVFPGETVAIVGPTGAGKTTLVNLIPRFFDPWEGRVLLDGRDVRDVQLKSLRRQIALVLQEPYLFPLTIAENIGLGRPDATRWDIEQAARAANLQDFIEQLPEGYDTLLGQRGATLSGGERQRLAIARALLRDAPIVILDEPTSALDSATEALVLEALGRLMQGRTTLLIAHRLSTVRAADRIVVLQHGRIVETGTHADLLGREGLYARFHGLQFETPAAVASRK
jgi:ATP-binding cassette subfamily B protein/subfamily B ATP-binding cassette protein MsbA